LPIDIEIDRLLNLVRSKLSYLSGSLAQAKDGLDPTETGGLSVLLAEVLDGVEAVHRLARESWGVPG